MLRLTTTVHHSSGECEELDLKITEGNEGMALRLAKMADMENLATCGIPWPWAEDTLPHVHQKDGIIWFNTEPSHIHIVHRDRDKDGRDGGYIPWLFEDVEGEEA